MATLPVEPPKESQKERKPFQDPEGRMTFTEHLGELRTRIVRSGIVVLIAMVVCYALSDRILTLLRMPLVGFATALNPDSATADVKWVALNPLEGILIKLKIAAYAGILLATPMILYQGCAFVFPGLKPNERRAVRIILYGSLTLAVAGVLVAYFGVLPFLVPYLVNFVPEWVEQQLQLSTTMSQVIKLMAGFALAFQFPMAVLVLVYLDLMSPTTLRQYRKIAWVVLLCIAMVLTPPDPFSMLIMGIPMCILYEVSILVSYTVARKKKTGAAA